MGAKRFMVDAGGITRRIKKRFVVDAGGVTRRIKKRYIIDPSGTARLTFNGNEDDFVVVAGTNSVNGTGFFHVSGNTFGSLTPTTVLGDGMSIIELYDDNTNHRTLTIGGFLTAPVATYLASITCAGPTLTPTSSTFTFTSIFNGSFGFLGRWQWSTSVSGFFVPGNTYPGVLIRS